MHIGGQAKEKAPEGIRGLVLVGGAPRYCFAGVVPGTSSIFGRAPSFS